ncbi:transcription initiation factor TFIID subunit 10b-like [Teleopsis dalmanni]|uniref:transcription initiation factor TFIID subunit 10b-like n=1 Tax=Teleopsis dalmanni TaxID=139649 RepID=UPI0018CF0B3C|nr:transcription initiation factor TFIID subunit 10b-like [Teleopsis dalmanni]
MEKEKKTEENGEVVDEKPVIENAGENVVKTNPEESNAETAEASGSNKPTTVDSSTNTNTKGLAAYKMDKMEALRLTEYFCQTFSEDRLNQQEFNDFMVQLHDYVPQVPDAVTSHYMRLAGLSDEDPKVVRLISLAVQKFISDTANDSFLMTRSKTKLTEQEKQAKDRKYTLTLDDAVSALNSNGFSIAKPNYYQ